MHGKSVNEIPHLIDKTPSPIKIAILLILLCLIYIAYQVFIIIWNNKRMDQLIQYRAELKQYKSGNKKSSKKATSQKPLNTATGEKTQRKVKERELFSDEDLKVLQEYSRL